MTPAICKLCAGLEVIRVFIGWDRETRRYVATEQPHDVDCPCTGRW